MCGIAGVFLSHGEAQEPQLPHLLDVLEGYFCLLVHLCRDGSYLFLGELPGHLADHPVLFVQLQIHRKPPRL